MAALEGTGNGSVNEIGLRRKEGSGSGSTAVIRFSSFNYSRAVIQMVYILF